MRLGSSVSSRSSSPRASITPNLLIGDEELDGTALASPTDTDFVVAAVVAQADLARRIDPVLAHAEVGAGLGACGPRLHAARVRLQGRAPPKSPVRAHVVVVVGEDVELALELRERGGGRLLGQVALERLVQPLHLAAGLRVIGA